VLLDQELLHIVYDALARRRPLSRTRVWARRVPDSKTLGKLGVAVVENNIHYPTDTALLGEAVRVLTRTM
jgi:hypothetical protein